jgi:hypothetical protein
MKAKAKNWLSTFYKKNKTDIDTVRNLIIYIILYGALLNFSLFVIFGIVFNFYSFFGWGVALWFIDNLFVKIIRRVIFRR